MASKLTDPIFYLDRTLFRAHRLSYRWTRGWLGHRIGRLTCALLITTGARTGKRRTTALVYGRDGERVILIASRGGAPAHPSWYVNLRANPEVEVQIGFRLESTRTA